VLAKKNTGSVIWVGQKGKNDKGALELCPQDGSHRLAKAVTIIESTKMGVQKNIIQKKTVEKENWGDGGVGADRGQGGWAGVKYRKKTTRL